MPKKSVIEAAEKAKAARQTDLTYPNRPKMLGGVLDNIELTEYRDNLRTQLFETVGVTEIDWAPPNSNSPHTTRHYWLMTDIEGVERKFCREMFHGISVGDQDSFRQNRIVDKVKKRVDQEMAADPFRLQPPEDLVKFRMAQQALSNKKQRGKYKGLSWLEAHKRTLVSRKGKGKPPFVDLLYKEALTYLWKHEERWQEVRNQYNAKTPDIIAAIAFIEKCTRHKLPKSPCESFDRDEIAGADEKILAKIPNDIIYLAVDRNNTGFMIRWPQCVQTLFGEDATTKAAEDVSKYHAIQPPPRPDPTRQPTDPYWGEKNPQFDNKRGVTYLGFGCQTGKPDKPAAIKKSSAEGPPEVAKIRQDMITGSLDLVSEAQRFILGIVSPELVVKRQAAIRKFPVAGIIPHGGAHNLTAILENVKSDSHRDTMDANFGYASLTPLGDFSGGDLIFRNQGVRVSLETGDVAVFMGHEMHHGTNWWFGKTRICIVNSFHQVIWRQENWPVGEDGVKRKPKATTNAAEVDESPQTIQSNSGDEQVPDDELPGQMPTTASRYPSFYSEKSDEWHLELQGRVGNTPNKRRKMGHN